MSKEGKAIGNPQRRIGLPIHQGASPRNRRIDAGHLADKRIRTNDMAAEGPALFGPMTQLILQNCSGGQFPRPRRSGRGFLIQQGPIRRASPAMCAVFSPTQIPGAFSVNPIRVGFTAFGIHATSDACQPAYVSKSGSSGEPGRCDSSVTAFGALIQPLSGTQIRKASHCLVDGDVSANVRIDNFYPPSPSAADDFLNEGPFDPPMRQEPLLAPSSREPCDPNSLCEMLAEQGHQRQRRRFRQLAGRRTRRRANQDRLHQYAPEPKSSGRNGSSTC